MGSYESGYWAVTTTADAYGDAEDENIDPDKADPEQPIWCVYDYRYDDEPIATGMFACNAQTVAVALNLFDQTLAVVVPFANRPEMVGACHCGHANGDHTIQHGCTYTETTSSVDGMSLVEEVCGCEAFRPATLAYKPRRDPYDTVEARGYFVVCCKACDAGTPLPMPFKTAGERSEWMTGHSQGTGHCRFAVIDPTPIRGEALPFGFAQAEEVTLGAITASGSTTGSALVYEDSPRARIMKLDEAGKPTGDSVEVKVNMHVDDENNWRPAWAKP